MKTEYKNIPETGFNSLTPEFKTEMIMASMRLRDVITLSFFSIWQIISGLNNMAETIAITGGKHLGDKSIAILQLSGKLFTAAMTITGNATPEAVVKIEVSREEVKLMLEMLKIRMTHCEKQRDARNEKFNPDTYIGQKLLLISIREWLMLDAVEVPMVKKTSDVSSD